MALGQKIKSARISKKISQSDLCQNKITRNMLSAIENDKASPSLDTVRFLAMRLELPISYLLSDDDDLFFYKKESKIKEIRRYYQDKKYKRCVDIILSLGDIDDELAYIMALSCFHLGRRAVLDGSLNDADRYLKEFRKYSDLTVYSTELQSALCEFYSAVSKNIKAPLLELDPKSFESRLDTLCDMDFYKFIMQDRTHAFKNPVFKKHLQAKSLIKERRYQEALSILREIEEGRSESEYNAHRILAMYADMESCYKQLGDFEKAYKYSTKQLTLTEQLKN